MPRILLAGAFGQANPGDEALLTAFVERLPSWDIVATSRDPDATRTTHACDAVHPAQLRHVARVAAKADAVVIAGGTIFKRLPSGTGRSALSLLGTSAALGAFTRVRGVPLALVGVGAGDLQGRSARLLARTLVRVSTMVILRDEESAGVLADAGVPTPFRVGADPAWVLWSDEPPGTPAGRNDGPVVVAVSRHAADEHDRGRLSRALAESLMPLVASGVAVEVQPWQVDDIPVARDTLTALPRKSARIVAPPPTLRDARREYMAARAVVGLRFHALVAAAAAGTPFVAYAHEPKLAALARRFSQPALHGVASLARLSSSIDAAIASPPAHSQARAETAKAEETFRLLHLLLSGGNDHDLATLAGLSLSDGATR